MNIDHFPRFHHKLAMVMIGNRGLDDQHDLDIAPARPIATRTEMANFIKLNRHFSDETSE